MILVAPPNPVPSFGDFGSLDHPDHGEFGPELTQGGVVGIADLRHGVQIDNFNKIGAASAAAGCIALA